MKAVGFKTQGCSPIYSELEASLGCLGQEDKTGRVRWFSNYECLFVAKPVDLILISRTQTKVE